MDAQTPRKRAISPVSAAAPNDVFDAPTAAADADTINAFIDAYNGDVVHSANNTNTGKRRRIDAADATEEETKDSRDEPTVSSLDCDDINNINTNDGDDDAVSDDTDDSDNYDDAIALALTIAVDAFTEDIGTAREPTGVFDAVPVGVHRWHPMYHTPGGDNIDHHKWLLDDINRRIEFAVKLARKNAAHQFSHTLLHDGRVCDPFEAGSMRSRPSRKPVNFQLTPSDRFMVVSTRFSADWCMPVTAPLRFAADIRLACARATTDAKSAVAFVATVVNGYRASLQAHNAAVIPARHKFTLRQWLFDAWMTLYVDHHPLVWKKMVNYSGFHCVVHELCDAYGEDALLCEVVVDSLLFSLTKFVQLIDYSTSDIRSFTQWARLDRDLVGTQTAARIMMQLIHQAAPPSVVHAMMAVFDRLRTLGDTYTHPWIRDDGDTVAAVVPVDWEAYVMTKLISVSVTRSLLPRQMRAYAHWIQLDVVQAALVRTFGAMRTSTYTTIWGELPKSHPFTATLHRLFRLFTNVSFIATPLDRNHSQFLWKHSGLDLHVWELAHQPWTSVHRIRRIIDEVARQSADPNGAEENFYASMSMLIGRWWDGSEPDVLSLLPVRTLNDLCALYDDDLCERIVAMQRRQTERARLVVFDAAAAVARLPRSCLHLVQQMASGSVLPNRPDTMVLARHAVLRTLRSLQDPIGAAQLSQRDMCVVLEDLCVHIERMCDGIVPPDYSSFSSPSASAFASSSSSTQVVSWPITLTSMRQLLAIASPLTFRAHIRAHIDLVLMRG